MITLENNDLRVDVSTGRSMRIESFFDKKKNKEWVWKPKERDEDLATKNLDLTASFDAHWAGGWEEVFPNDAPCELNSRQLVDHGEVWRKNWEYKKESDLSLTAYFTCETLPLQIRKTFVLDTHNPELTIQYEIKNLSKDDCPYLFKFHPALNIEEGDRFVLPKSKMRPVALAFSRLLSSEDEVPFPTGRGIGQDIVSIDKVKKNDGYSREFVRISELKDGKCSLYSDAINTELLFEFSLKEIPYVWLFQSYGGFMDHYVAMLEPTNASHYDLAKLVQEKNAEVIRGNQSKSFTIKISLRDL